MPNILETYRQYKALPRLVKTPQVSEFSATALVALTIILLIFSGVIGTYAIILFYILWLPRFFYRKKFVPYFSRDVWLIYIFLGLCIASVIWSDYPSVTLRASLELASMVLIAVVIARLTSTAAFVKGLAVGAFLVLLATFASGHFAIESIFGSKNQAGYVAEVGVFASVVYLFSAARRRSKAVFVPVFLFCGLALFLSHSATAVVSLAVALLASALGGITARLPRRIRGLGLAALIVIGSIAVLAATSFGLQAALFQSLGKDTTLTGRTYLWGEGMKIALQQPILGLGYSAFWVQGRQLAEQYWYEFYIPTRSGFHFHNLYIETFVELGGAGLFLLILLVCLTGWQSLLYVLKKGRDTTGIFCLGLFFMLLVRTFVEVDFLGQFGIGQLLFFGILPRLAMRPAEEAVQRR